MALLNNGVTLHDIGKAIFFDPDFSENGRISCATCHDPAKAFTDGKARALGVRNRVGTRNTPSLLNVREQTSLFWDGRVTSLEEQAILPLLNPIEHGLLDRKVLTRKLSNSPYRQAIKRVFKSETATSEHAALALAEFQRRLVALNSPFDQYYYAGVASAISPSAIRGLELFKGIAGCSTCHIITGDAAPFSDQKFHLSPLRISDAGAKRMSQMTLWAAKLHDEGKILELDRAITSDPLIAGLGRFVVTLEPSDIGKFKTPSLRNVAVTGPYMHDGSISTLAQVIEMELYSHDGSGLEPIILTPAEKIDLEEFLRALTDLKWH